MRRAAGLAAAGHISALATTKTVTYKITAIRLNSPDFGDASPYSCVLLLVRESPTARNPANLSTHSSFVSLLLIYNTYSRMVTSPNPSCRRGTITLYASKLPVE